MEEYKLKKIIKENAVILSNLSDLSVEDSEILLTSIVNNFNLKTDEDVIQLLNTLNNLSNKRAVTVEQLLQSLSKTAVGNIEVFTPEKVAEYATTMMEATRESGDVTGKILKGFLGRVESVDISVDKETLSLLRANNINVDDRTENLIDELASKWNSLAKSIQEDISLRLAGRYNLAKFKVLLNGLAD